MKKLLSLFLTILLVVSLVFVVTGCGKKNEQTEPANTNTENTQNVEENNNANEENDADASAKQSKTYKVVSKLKGSYVMSMEQIGDEETGEITLAIKDGKMYMDATSDGERVSIIYKDNVTYMISHAEKAYMEMQGKMEDEFDSMDFISDEDLEEIKSSEFKTGKETIDGVEYDYEEFNNEGTERYYFIGDDLKYIKQLDDEGEQTIKINQLSSEVDDSLFEIPAGYSKLEM